MILLIHHSTFFCLIGLKLTNYRTHGGGVKINCVLFEGLFNNSPLQSFFFQSCFFFFSLAGRYRQRREGEEMAALDTDLNMLPPGEGSAPSPPGSSAASSSGKKVKRFEIKKWNAVALWAWGAYFPALGPSCL